MAVKVTWYGHACFHVEGSGAMLLLDPFISGNPLSPLKADEVAADVRCPGAAVSGAWVAPGE